MVDKLWNDWQHANPANFWSFGGGSVSAAQGFEPDATFPTGLPPYVNVRSFLTTRPFRLTKALLVLDADPD